MLCKDIINLAHNTHLRKFHLKFLYYDVTWIITLLSQITSPYLVEMCLEFNVDYGSLPNAIDWTQLADVFNQQHWSNLLELRVLYYIIAVSGKC